MWPLRRAAFGEIDDHEIVDMLDGHARLPVTRLPATFIHYTAERNGRFRPGYWLLRVLEASVAGNHAAWWYADRYLLALITAYAAFIAGRSVLPDWIASIAALLPFCGPQFEAWTRLGPNEAYAVPLTTVALALVAVRVRQQRTRPMEVWLAWALLLLAGLCKENFLLLLPVGLGVSLAMTRPSAWRKRDWATVLGAMGPGVLALSVTLWKVRAYGDLYGQHRTPAALTRRLYVVAANEVAFGRWELLGAIVLAVVLMARPAPLTRLLVLCTAGALVVLLQCYFYAAAPDAGRYLYPVALLPACSFAVAATVRSWTLRPGWLVYALVLPLAVVPVSVGYKMGQAQSVAEVVTSNAFQRDIRAIEAFATKSKVRNIVLQSSNPEVDIEPIYSLAIYLHARQSHLTVMVLPATTPATAQGRSLNQTIASWSRHGGHDIAPFVPTECASVLLGPGHSACEAEMTLSVRPPP